MMKMYSESDIRKMWGTQHFEFVKMKREHGITGQVIDGRRMYSLRDLETMAGCSLRRDPKHTEE